MRRSLFRLLRSESGLVNGTFGRLADRFGWDRLTTRILGALIVLGCPYVLGANLRNAWWISLLLYVGLSVATSNRGHWVGRRCGQRDRRRPVPGQPYPYQQGQKPPAKVTTAPPPATAAPEKQTGLVPGQASAAGTINGRPIDGQEFSDLLARVEDRMLRLSRRIEAMESIVTDRSFDWDRRLRNG